MKLMSIDDMDKCPKWKTPSLELDNVKMLISILGTNLQSQLWQNGRQGPPYAGLLSYVCLLILFKPYSHVRTPEVDLEEKRYPLFLVPKVATLSI